MPLVGVSSPTDVYESHCIVSQPLSGGAEHTTLSISQLTADREQEISCSSHGQLPSAAQLERGQVQSCSEHLAALVLLFTFISFATGHLIQRRTYPKWPVWCPRAPDTTLFLVTVVQDKGLGLTGETAVAGEAQAEINHY